jgi:hypothetical protein
MIIVLRKLPRKSQVPQRPLLELSELRYAMYDILKQHMF